MFSWETGRILDEYHFVLITEGKGVFESESGGVKNISAGDGFLLYPREWHRYKPLKQTGWTENWIGFSGKIPELIISNSFFDRKQPIIRKCATVPVLNHFKNIFQLINEEPYGYQRLASGVCLQLLAELYNSKQGIKQNNQQNFLFSKAKHFVHNHINETIDFKKMAESFG